MAMLRSDLFKALTPAKQKQIMAMMGPKVGHRGVETLLPLGSVTVYNYVRESL